ncbi:hypothetical protein C8Q77DRAFT_1209911 [Trametes polyzona]|nr:hypothetical protein C8Q77DRAFT_1209911 [Trametes polyzona]
MPHRGYSQAVPDISGRPMTAAEVFGTARLLQNQLLSFEVRHRASAEREHNLLHARSELQEIHNGFAALEEAEARATAELSLTLDRLRTSHRTSLTQSQSQTSLVPTTPTAKRPFRFGFPLRSRTSRPFQFSFQMQTPSPQHGRGTARRGSPASAPPGRAPRESMAAPLARLARGALARTHARPLAVEGQDQSSPSSLSSSSSPRGPLRPASVGADADTDPRTAGDEGGSQPAGGRSSIGTPLALTSSSSLSSMSDAEAALARALQVFFASRDTQAVKQPPALPAVVHGVHTEGEGEEGEGKVADQAETPTRAPRHVLFDPRLREVALGAHVVTAARVGSSDDVDDSDANDDVMASPSPSPGLQLSLSDTNGIRDSDTDAGAGAGAQGLPASLTLSAGLADRLGLAAEVVRARRGYADRLGEHEIAPDPEVAETAWGRAQETSAALEEELETAARESGEPTHRADWSKLGPVTHAQRMSVASPVGGSLLQRISGSPVQKRRFQLRLCSDQFKLFGLAAWPGKKSLAKARRRSAGSSKGSKRKSYGKENRRSRGASGVPF